MWQKISIAGEAPTHLYRSDRLRVHGGWIVRTITGNGNDAGTCVVQTFIADPGHVWTLSEA
ncbi:MAG TPA: hypothetical protein VJH33_03400 [Candidatus Paceibacterota bacterium]